MISKIIRIIPPLRKLLIYLLIKTARLYPDKLFLKILFQLRTGYRLNLKNPQTFNEKLQWLKLNNRNPICTQMVDKIEVKKYVASIIGEEYLIPTLAVYESAEEIDFSILPNQFVLKCTHDSGGIVVCRDKSNLDINVAKEKMKKGLKRDYFYRNREWPYKNVLHRIIAEQYMEDESGYELKDYKFFCFDGVPKLLFVATDRGLIYEETKFDFYDMQFNHLPFTNGHPNSNKTIIRPRGFEQMKDIAAKLSKGFPHLRVDLYDINGRVYFGELTFYHWSGMTPFEPIEWDYKLGNLIELPNSKEVFIG